jgi:dolichyl-diphosphooligosaccharide--protein glycosyltransferase
VQLTDEAFTSENWIVRIYQVKKEDPLGREHKAVNAFEAGKRLKKSKSTVGSGGTKKSRPST